MNRDSGNKMEGQRLGMLIFECVMALLYLLFGGLFLFTPFLSSSIVGWVRIALGVLLAVYGIFRVFRALRKIF